MKIILVQYNPAWEDKERNKSKILSLLDGKDIGGSLLIFPEMTLTGFSMNAGQLAEVREGESFQFFSGLAKKFSCYLFAGIIENDNGKFYNALICLNKDGTLINYYRKIHPFSFSDEDKYYTGGNKPVVAKINDWKIGLSICYDLRFPELFRFYGKERVDLIVNIANWPIPRIEHWRTLLKARAIENQCYAAGVNRVGNDPKVEYNGLSSIYDPMGIELLSVESKEGIFDVEIDKKKIEEVQTQLPFLNDIKLI